MASSDRRLNDHYPGLQQAERDFIVPLVGLANATRDVVVFRVLPDVRITIQNLDVINVNLVPTSAIGTILLTVQNRDLSAGADDNLLVAANFDLETVAADSETALGLSVAAGILELDEGDVISAAIASNNADAVDMDGLALRVRYLPRADA